MVALVRKGFLQTMFPANVLRRFVTACEWDRFRRQVVQSRATSYVVII